MTAGPTPRLLETIEPGSGPMRGVSLSFRCQSLRGALLVGVVGPATCLISTLALEFLAAQ